MSIEKSEYLSELLKRRGIEHQVLNAKLHEKEAGIVAQAGRFGGVTIATNMAGRGTDIVLGGKPEGRDEAEWQDEHNHVVEAGGLAHRRHRAPRVAPHRQPAPRPRRPPGRPRQLALLRLVRGRHHAPIRARLAARHDGQARHGRGRADRERDGSRKAIETAQTKVEGHNFDIRKHVVEYDDVMNTQRDVIYTDRRAILEGGDVKDRIIEWVDEEIEALINSNMPTRDVDDWDLETLIADVNAIVKLSDEFTPDALARMTPEEIFDAIKQYAADAYEDREEEMTPEVMRQLERLVMLRSIDSLWVEHLTAMDEMRQGIGLQAYGQQDPLVAYKREAHDMWDAAPGEHPQPRRPLDLPRRSRHPARAPDRATRHGRHAARRQRSERRGRASARTRCRWRCARCPRSARRRNRRRRAGAAQSSHQPAGRGRRHDRRRRPEGRPQRSLPLRQRQEVQEVPRRLTAADAFILKELPSS